MIKHSHPKLHEDLFTVRDLLIIKSNFIFAVILSLLNNPMVRKLVFFSFYKVIDCKLITDICSYYILYISLYILNIYIKISMYKNLP